MRGWKAALLKTVVVAEILSGIFITQRSIPSPRVTQIVSSSAAAPMVAPMPPPTSHPWTILFPVKAESVSPPVTLVVSPSTTTSTTVTVKVISAPEASGYSTLCYPAVGMAPRNSTEACISKDEHGGCYDRSGNATHFGRWQFDYDTWVGNGGSPHDWGYASPAEQDAVFKATVASNGYGPWIRYDGC